MDKMSGTDIGKSQPSEEKPKKRTTFAEDVDEPRSSKPQKTEPTADIEEERKEFGSNLDAVISVIANAVGLGNVWRFPYQCYKNGGGAFFIPYTLMLIIAAMPIMGMEMAWGQFTSLGPVECWNCYPLLGGVGLGGIAITWLIIIYYSVLTAYALFYLGISLYSLKDINNPIWNGCDNDWNTAKCLTLDQFRKKREANITMLKSSYAIPTGEFWYNFVSMDDGSIRDFGYPNWKMVISSALIWAIVLISLWRGVRSMGKANYLFATFPYLCIIFLVCAGMFKEGAAEGVLMYLVPDFSKLLEIQVWADAGQQIFFSLTLCQGVLATLSSFNGFHQQCLENTFIVVVFNCVTSFWVGLPIFAVLGHMAHEMDTTVDEVIDSGPGLAFIAYPQALSLLPGAAIWSIFFCAMLVSVGLGSCTTDTETCIAQIIDLFPSLRSRKKEMAFRGCFVLSIFLLGLPMICTRGGMALLNLDDSFCTGINSYIFGVTVCVVLGYLYGMERFEEDVTMMIGRRPSRYWIVTWRYLSPMFLIFMGVIWIVNKAKEWNTEPDWASTLGWMISLFTVLPVPLYALFVMFREPTGLSCTSYKKLTRPNAQWGPRRQEDRTGRYEKIIAEDANDANGGDVENSM